VDLAMAIAGQLALSLENAELARRSRGERALNAHELSRAVTGWLDQADLLDTIEADGALLDVRLW
jgi:GAF domain-containing protein